MLEDSYPIVREEMATLKVTQSLYKLSGLVWEGCTSDCGSQGSTEKREEGCWLPFPARSEKPEKAMPRLAEADPARPCVAGPGEACIAVIISLLSEVSSGAALVRIQNAQPRVCHTDAQ